MRTSNKQNKMETSTLLKYANPRRTCLIGGRMTVFEEKTMNETINMLHLFVRLIQSL